MWIEICSRIANQVENWSRPARALWIEIVRTIKILPEYEVEAREGLVD